MPNDIRTQNAPTLQYKDLEIGALFRFLGQSDLQEVWIKGKHSGVAAVSLKNGNVSSAAADTPVYRVHKVTLTSPGTDRPDALPRWQPAPLAGERDEPYV